ASCLLGQPNARYNCLQRRRRLASRSARRTGSPPGILRAGGKIMPRPGVAVQMFSLRDEARADFVGTLRGVVAGGHTAVEAAFGYGGLSASQLRRALDDLGVRVIASHVGVDRLLSSLDEEIDFNLAIGNRDLLLAELPPEDRADEAAFHRWA